MKLKKRLVLGIFSLLSLVFIFFNSSQSSIKSNARSFEIAKKVSSKIKDYPNMDAVLNSIIDTIAKLEQYNIEGALSTEAMINILIRKLAHGFEFFILGIGLSFVFYIIKLKKINIAIYSLFLVLLSAVCDEFFQLFVDGRTSTVMDIVIDFIGGIIACIVFFIGTAIYNKFKNNK